jgi:hypothetical protein
VGASSTEIPPTSSEAEEEVAELLLHGGDRLHHGLHQLSLHCKNLMECLTIAEVLVLALLVVVIAGLLTCIAVGVHHLMVARKCHRAGHKKGKKDMLPY